MSIATVDLKIQYPIPKPRDNECALFDKSKKNENSFEEPVRALLTDFVVNKLLLDDINKDNKSNQRKYIRFLKLIFLSFEKFITEYRAIHQIDSKDLFFVYKGGCLLRISYLQYKSNLNSVIPNIDNLFEDYDQAFKVSDADFVISINPNIDNYKKISEDMNMYTFKLLTEIRDIILKEPEEYFDFLSEMVISRIPSYQKLANDINTVLEKYPDRKTGKIIKLKRISLFNDTYDPANVTLTFNEIQSTRKDLLITDKNGKTAACNIGNKEHVVYASNNKTISFNKGTNDILSSAFDLLRCKINFTCTFTLEDKDIVKYLGGELIDISIPRVDDNINSEFFRYKYNEKHIIRYIGTDGYLEGLEFFGFDLRYLIKDVSSILYVQTPFPWLDPKYLKRMKRHHVLLSLLFVKLNTEEDMRFGIDCFNFAKNTLRLNETITEKINLFKNKILEIGKHCNNENLDICKNDFFNCIKEFLSYLVDIFTIIEKKEDIIFMKENYPFTFLQSEFDKHLPSIISELEKNILYCGFMLSFFLQDSTRNKLKNVNNTLNLKRITFTQLGGTATYQKYLHYKHKYLQLKNKTH